MATITMEEYEEFPTFPVDSILFLKIDDCAVREINGPRGTFKKLEFTFKILGVQAAGDGSSPGDYDVQLGRSIYGSVPFRFNDSPENKLKQWVEAVLGIELGIGFELDTELLKGRSVRGVTSQYEKKNIDPRTGKGFLAHQIDSLLPQGGNVINPTPPPVQQPAGVASGSSWGGPPPADADSWMLADEPPF